MNLISPLSVDDLSEAFYIEQVSHLFPWTEKNFRSSQGEHYLNLKISINGQLAGFAISQVVMDEATLLDIVIKPDCQRMGLARMLLNQLMVQLAGKKVRTLWLEVRVSNQNAITLYQSLGFNVVSIRPDYYPAANGREDATIMALTL